MKVKALVDPSCLTFCDPMDHSSADSSVQGTFQARILEAFPSPGDLPDPVIETASPEL